MGYPNARAQTQLCIEQFFLFHRKRRTDFVFEFSIFVSALSIQRSLGGKGFIQQSRHVRSRLFVQVLGELCKSYQRALQINSCAV